MGDRIPVLLLGNKIDNETEREVPRGLGEQLAKVRGKHPVSGWRGTLRRVGHVPQSRAGILLGEAPGKEASGPDGVLASGQGWGGGVQLLCTWNFVQRTKVARQTCLGCGELPKFSSLELRIMNPQRLRLRTHLVVSDSVTPWTVATRLLCPWDSPGKNTGMSCHFLLQGNFLTQVSDPSLPASPESACDAGDSGRFFYLQSHWGSLNPPLGGGSLFQPPSRSLSPIHLCFLTYSPSQMTCSLPARQCALPWSMFFLLEHPSFPPRLSLQTADSRQTQGRPCKVDH